MSGDAAEGRAPARPGPAGAGPSGELAPLAARALAAELIKREREHQLRKGYDAKHDDAHTGNELMDAATFFEVAALADRAEAIETDMWPFLDREPPEATGPEPLDDLIKAAALLHAEIERRLRAGKRPTPPSA